MTSHPMPAQEGGITIRKQSADPAEPGDYAVCLRGSPLVVMARWTGADWRRGATLIHGGPWGWAGPITIERRKE